MHLLIAIVVFANEAPLVDVTTLDQRLLLDIRYATEDNFTGAKLYPTARCLLRPEVARMLVKAQDHLETHHPKYRLLLKDCYRPVHVQQKMWDAVKDTTMRGYVADPSSKTGSVHNYGAAVDLSVAGPDGRELDMGSPYDHLGPLSEPRREQDLLQQGKLSHAQVQNRHLLRQAMVEGGGFKTISNEWWHFDALRGSALRKRYSKLDVALEFVP